MLPNTYWKRWRFELPADPTAVPPVPGEIYSFSVNPHDMESPWWDMEYETDVTTAGTVLLTKSPSKPKELQFSGVVLDMEQYDALVKWLRTKRRLYMWDHMDRRYEVVVKSFAPKATAPTTRVHPGKHEYTMTVLVLSEPVVMTP